MRLGVQAIAASAPVFVVAVIIAVGVTSRVSIKSDVSKCYTQGCFDTEFGKNYREAIQIFIKGTRFEGKLNVTEAPIDGYLNVYFSKAPLQGRLAPINCNCAYLGFSTIICDKKFLESFSSAVHFTRASFYGPDSGLIWEQQKHVFEQANDDISKVLLSWPIGHEVGHAVLHDATNFERRRAVTETQELQADAFYIDKSLEGADTRKRQKLSWALNQFIFSIVGATFRERDDNHSGSAAVIAPSIDGIHPPWLIRALKLGQRMVEPDSEKQKDTFYAGLSSSVEVSPRGKDIGSLCAFEKLRELATQRQMKQLHIPPQ